MRVSSPTRQRRLGVYYTPQPLADVMTKWAVRSSSDRVLDPSYGGCGFVGAAVRRLATLGCNPPGLAVYGVDVDPNCRRYVREDSHLLDQNFRDGDFLRMKPERDLGGSFDAIVGNPPYVRHHWLKGAATKGVVAARKSSSASLSGRSSLWAYFVMHSLQFLNGGGRLALVLPESLLQADYAREVVDTLSNRFASLRLVRIRERLFEGTSEAVIVLLAEGIGPGTVSVTEVPDVSAIAHNLARAAPDSGLNDIHLNGRLSIDDPAAILFQDITSRDDVLRIDNLADIRIGIVTGASPFFLLNRLQAKAFGISLRQCSRVVSKASQLSGLFIQAQDIDAQFSSGARILLPKARTPLQRNACKKWVILGEKAGINKYYKCSIRDPWYAIDTGLVPDALVTCGRGAPPKLVLNPAAVLCTNTLHAVYWKSKTCGRRVAVGFLSSMTALAAELIGRRYGGGMLKMEPSDLRRLPVPVVEVGSADAKRIDRLLRANEESKARDFADEVTLRQGLGLSKHEIKVLRTATSDLAAQRRLQIAPLSPSDAPSCHADRRYH